MANNRRDFLGMAAGLPLLPGLVARADSLPAPLPTETPLGPTLPFPLKGAPGGTVTAAADFSSAQRKKIYAQLGFATMTGEDPLRMWTRLRPTERWICGPLAADGSLGQAFIADHADIFAFRFTPLAPQWMVDFVPGKIRKARYSGERFDDWCKNTSEWWTRPGPFAPDGSYGSIHAQVPAGGPLVTYEWARTGQNEIVCKISQSVATEIVIQAYVPWETDPSRFNVLYSDSVGRRAVRGRSFIPGTQDGHRFVLAFSERLEETNNRPLAPDFLTPATPDKSLANCKWHGLIAPVSTLYLCARQGDDYESLEAACTRWLVPGRIDELLQSNRETYLSKRPTGQGALTEVLAAINDPVLACEVYEPLRRSTYLAVSRTWVAGRNNAYEYYWDNMFASLLMCQEAPEKAHTTVRSVMRWQTDQGMQAQVTWADPYPNQISFPVAWGNTGPMIGSLLVAKMYLRAPNPEFLRDLYPRLLKSNRWWFADRGDGQPWRDGNRNGLLEFGCNYPEEIPNADRLQVAFFESLDDSPQWRNITTFNDQTQTIEQETMLCNCLYAMDCRALAWIATTLGETADAERLQADHRAMKSKINRLLWHGKRRCYFNRRWSPLKGDWHFPQVASDIFLALTAGVAEAEQASALREKFNDPRLFAGEWLVPTISRDDAAFPDQQYWRGKVWPPMNWLIYQGLKEYGWDTEAHALAESSLKMYMKPWREKGEFHENFLSTTGGDDGLATKHYHWGALMALISVEELIDANPTDGLRIGNLTVSKASSIHGYSIAGAVYDVALDAKRFEVHRNGRRLFLSDSPLELKEVRFMGDRISATVRATTTARLKIADNGVQDIAAGVTHLTASL